MNWHQGVTLKMVESLRRWGFDQFAMLPVVGFHPADLCPWCMETLPEGADVLKTDAGAISTRPVSLCPYCGTVYASVELTDDQYPHMLVRMLRASPSHILAVLMPAESGHETYDLLTKGG